MSVIQGGQSKVRLAGNTIDCMARTGHGASQASGAASPPLAASSIARTAPPPDNHSLLEPGSTRVGAANAGDVVDSHGSLHVLSDLTEHDADRIRGVLHEVGLVHHLDCLP